MNPANRNIDGFIEKKRKVTLAPFLLFIVAPVLSLPSIITQIYNQRRGAILCLSMFFAIGTYLLLPDWSLDLARYYVKYSELENLTNSQFFLYLQTSSDYVFYSLMFLFGKFGIKFQVLLFLMSTFNFYVFFSFFEKFSKYLSISKLNYLSSFIFYSASITILYYLSSTRYILGNSFFLLFISAYFFSNNRKTGVLLYVLSVLSHTAFLIYLPFIFTISKIKNKKGMIIISVIFFLVFSFIPVSTVLSVASSILPNFVDKALVYKDLDRASNWAPTVSHFIIIVTALFFLMKFYNKIPAKFLNILLSLLLPVLLSIPFGFISYDRYIIAFKPFLFLILIYCGSKYSGGNLLTISVLKTILAGAAGLYIIYSLYLYRLNIAPYFRLDNVFLFDILQKNYDFSDFFNL